MISDWLEIKSDTKVNIDCLIDIELGQRAKNKAYIQFALEECLNLYLLIMRFKSYQVFRTS